MIFNIFNKILKNREDARKIQLQKSLIRHEARIGGELFGPVQPGARREFFCLDEYTWVWHEEWVDEQGMRRIKTTRYDIRPDRIVKVQDGQYKDITKEEAKRLVQAAQLYEQRVANELYAFAA